MRIHTDVQQRTMQLRHASRHNTTQIKAAFTVSHRHYYKAGSWRTSSSDVCLIVHCCCCRKITVLTNWSNRLSRQHWSKKSMKAMLKNILNESSIERKKESGRFNLSTHAWEHWISQWPRGSCSESRGCAKKHKMTRQILSIQTDLQLHQLWHTNKRTFTCSTCWRSVLTESQLIQHTCVVTGKGRFTYDNFMCTWESVLPCRAVHIPLHVDSHIGNQPYRCKMSEVFAHRSPHIGTVASPGFGTRRGTRIKRDNN